MEEKYEEYITFHVTAKDGTDVEMAVMDEFDYEHKHYVVGAVVLGDIVNEEHLYIYKMKLTEGDFTVEKIESQEEYKEIAQAYTELVE